ncbi:gentisate 1,2-dioxygenase [Aspergillus awamori]|uniref:Gentisate 1,2-dioxygenase n=1 Tax=Aspergillus awamori TaxID=105351 RepID=A0A401KFH5_ASPAW|nr:gentisate 1,2-dioxygenase [Aspergillus awamori]
MIKAGTSENMENSTLHGSCLCTTVRFSVQGNPEKVFICYCQDCVKNSGAPYQLCAKYHRSQLHIEGSGDGYVGTWVVTKTTSGAEKHKKFCTQCGCTLWTVPMNHAGENVIVRAALIDDGSKMSATPQQTSTSLREEFEASAHSKNYQPLWTVFGQMVPSKPNPRAVPAIWRYNQLRPDLMKSGTIITAEEAERRVLMLVNPNMDAPHTTDTIYGGLQLVLPGETAPAHRHVAFALRFIIEGNDGFTAIEGQKIRMETGDVILTPSWCWHDHGNEGKDPMIWLDGLDLPLFRRFPVNFAEEYTECRYPALDTQDSPIRFPWRDVQAKLDGANLPYAVYHYKEGEALEIEWKEKDTFAVPAWCQIQHVCLPGEPAYLFAINDRPMLESLGFIRQA